MVPEKEDVLARHFPLLDGGAAEEGAEEQKSELDAGPVPLPDDIIDEEEQPTKSAISPLDAFFIDDDIAEEE